MPIDLGPNVQFELSITIDKRVGPICKASQAICTPSHMEALISEAMGDMTVSDYAHIYITRKA